MTKKKIECSNCESEFTISHQMDKDHYTPSYCVFCGTFIEPEVELEFIDGDDE